MFTRFHVNALNPAILGEQAFELRLTGFILKVSDENRLHLQTNNSNQNEGTRSTDRNTLNPNNFGGFDIRSEQQQIKASIHTSGQKKKLGFLFRLQ